MKWMRVLWTEQKNKVSLLIAGGWVMLLLGYLLLLMPLQEKKSELGKQLADFKAQVERLQAYNMSAEEFELKHEQLKASQQEIRKTIPDKLDDFTAVTELNAAIKANNLNIRGIKINTPLMLEGCKLQRLDCAISGGYFELLALLQHLQQRNPLTDVQISAINLEADGNLAVNMQVRIYVLE